MDTIVVLDRIEPGQPKPDYCIHGKVPCAGCQDWCWLGDKTYDVVKTGQAKPLCHQCAGRLIPAEFRRVANVGDHRRAAGPH